MCRVHNILLVRKLVLDNHLKVLFDSESCEFHDVTTEKVEIVTSLQSGRGMYVLKNQGSDDSSQSSALSADKSYGFISSSKIDSGFKPIPLNKMHCRLDMLLYQECYT